MRRPRNLDGVWRDSELMENVREHTAAGLILVTECYLDEERLRGSSQPGSTSQIDLVTLCY
jgi:hypothetical protein